jgi:hypothetical protein
MSSKVTLRSRIRQAFPLITAGMLALGIVIHVYSLANGRQAVVDHLLTPTVDVIASLPMAFVTICFWRFRREAVFARPFDRVGYYFLAVYFTGSLPLHASTLFTGDPTRYLQRFPGWYSWLILPVMVVFLTVALRIRFRTSDS